MQQGGIQIVHVNSVLDRIETKLVARPDGHSRLGTTARHPHGKAIWVVIATVMMTAGWPVLTSRIGSVLPGSAADRAGLQGGDRIVALNDSEISRWDDLVQRIRALY